MNEVKPGRMAGPYINRPISNLRCSPIGIVPKTAGYRLISLQIQVLMILICWDLSLKIIISSINVCLWAIRSPVVYLKNFYSVGCKN